jgi:hypothetical protein
MKEITIMHANWKVVLAFALVAAVPLHLRAADTVLTAKEAHQLEASAKTVSDHARLAEFYRLQAQQTEQKLAGAKEQMKRASWLENSTKVPNAYTMARNNAERYSEQLEKSSKLAANHENAAKSLEAAADSRQ